MRILFFLTLIISCNSVFSLTEIQLFQFITDYCVNGRFKSVTLITHQEAQEDSSAFFPLLQLLNERGIRLAIIEPPVNNFHNVIKYTSSFTLHIVHHNIKLNLEQANLPFASGKNWLMLGKDLTQIQNFLVRIDSDVFTAQIYSQSVEIGEVYSVGGIIKHQVVGSWHTDTHKLDMFGLQTFKLRRRQNLMGMKVKVSSVHLNTQYTILHKDESGKSTFAGGYVGNMLTSFQEVFNITYDIKPLDGYAYGLYEPSNDSWTGLMGDLQRGVADVGGCEISNAGDRLGYVDFTQPIQIIGRQLHFKKPDRQFNSDAFLRPFSPSIWVSLSLTLPLAASIKYLLYKLSPSGDGEGATNFGADFFGVFSALVVQGWSGYFGAPSRRFFIWTIFACYMIVSIAYSAKMVAMRTNDKPQLPINSLTDVLNKADWDFGFIAKALERGMFQFSSPDSLLGKIWSNKVVAKKEKTLVANLQEGLTKTFESKYVFMCFNLACRQVLQREFGLEKSCQIHVLRDNFFKHGLSIGLKKNSELRELFDYRIMIMYEAGLLDIGLQHSMGKEAVCEEEPFTKINILDVAPAMMLLSFGMVLALFVLFAEHAWLYRRKYLSKGGKIKWSKLWSKLKNLGMSREDQQLREFRDMILKLEDGKILK